MVKSVRLEFAGGAETLFDFETPSKDVKIGHDGIQRWYDLSVPDSVGTVGDLMDWVRLNTKCKRPEMFYSPAPDYIQAGYLLIVNDVDWEVNGRSKAEIGNGDRVLIVSVVHGG